MSGYEPHFPVSTAAVCQKFQGVLVQWNVTSGVQE